MLGTNHAPFGVTTLAAWKSGLWLWKVPATLLSPSEPAAFRYPLWRQHCSHPPRDTRFSRHTAMAGGSHSYGQWPLTLQCFVSFTHVPNEMHFSEPEHKVPDLSPQAEDFSVWKCSSANSLSHTSVYLCLLFWLQFTSFSPLLPASVLSDFVPSLPACSLNFYLRPCLSYRGNAALRWWSLWELIFK